MKQFLMRNGVKVFWIALLTAVLMFLPYLVMDNGLFLYYGDYNVQQIPFYKLAHEAIRSGNIWWNWNTDLGANFIGSYSFYLLGSPFFYLTLPFPTDFVPYLMAPLLMIKFACAALTGYYFIKRFVNHLDYAVIGGLLYAFCGFNVYNIFFNHFHEPVVFFPLLLIALEEFIQYDRRGLFALAVAINAVVNYFFFAGQAVFVLLYFIVRCFDKDFVITAKKFLLLALETIIGVLLSACLLLPSALAIMDNPRTDSFLLGWDMLSYNNVQRYFLIFQSLFFPPDIPARPNFFPDSNAKWSSVSAFLPLFGMTGVLALMKSRKKHFLRRMLLICGVMAIVPVLNSAFYAFNTSYYARWFYMPVLLMALATVIAIEQDGYDLKFGVKFSAWTIAIFGLIGILPRKNDGQIVFFDLPKYPAYFWAYVGIAVLGILLVVMLLKFYRRHPHFLKITTACLCCVIVLYSTAILAMGRANGDTYDTMTNKALGGKYNISLEDDTFYRIDVYKGVDNYGMFWGIPTIQAFHSVVPGSVIEFYRGIGIARDVATRPDLTFLGLRGLTSVKYLFADQTQETKPAMHGFELVDNQNGFDIYENKYFIPMGFTYDYYVTQQQFQEFKIEHRDRLLLKGMLLDEQQIATYGHLLSPLSDTQLPSISDEETAKNCVDRASVTCHRFEIDNHGFTAQIRLQNEELVCFSVPYDTGWTATVNGAPVKVEKVNNGLTAVAVSAGESVIRFDYYTPGLKMGLLLTMLGAIMLIGYFFVIWLWRKKHGRPVCMLRRTPMEGYIETVKSQFED